ncbi:MAG: Holliday junction resolvase RuvX [Thermoleophilia bacterium]|nr:Holliday junction resolvase RuvX [Thermoleophilia bacterium]
MKKHARVLAIDYGRARTGAAVGDPTGTIVRPLEEIDEARTPEGLKKIAAMAIREEAGLVVVGMPVSLNGTRGDQAQETDEFIRELSAALPVPVIAFDERFTSKIARARGRTSGASPHSIAACVLLEDFLGSEEYRSRGLDR